MLALFLFLAWVWSYRRPSSPRWTRSPIWIEDGKSHLNPHSYKYLTNNPDVCDGRDIDLLILVSSSINHFAQREAIRRTWGSKLNLAQVNGQVMFLLGHGEEQQVAIDQENLANGDIIQEDFKVHDCYCTLTLVFNIYLSRMCIIT